MPKTTGLTEKQLKILRFIQQELGRTGNVPTYRAIAQHFKLSAVGTVQDYISKLIEQGYLEKPKGSKRGFKLPQQTQVTSIPLLGSVPAGRPLEAIEDHQGSLSLSGRWSGELFALRVSGESMRDAGILNGDFVIVRKQSDAEEGEIVVASINQEATVKILSKEGKKIRLIPANPDFKPIDLSDIQESQIIGKVISIQRMYE